MVMTSNSFEKVLDREIRGRVEAIEDPSYDFGPRFSSTSWLIVGLVLTACLAAIFLV